jgi:hypothetical protein
VLSPDSLAQSPVREMTRSESAKAAALLSRSCSHAHASAAISRCGNSKQMIAKSRGFVFADITCTEQMAPDIIPIEEVAIDQHQLLKAGLREHVSHLRAERPAADESDLFLREGRHPLRAATTVYPLRVNAPHDVPSARVAFKTFGEKGRRECAGPKAIKFRAWLAGKIVERN